VIVYRCLANAVRNVPETSDFGALQIGRSGHGIASLPSQAAGVPEAIRNINESPDPSGAYLNAAQDTASQGAGQALTALMGAEVAKTVPAAVRFGARSTEAAVNQKLVPVRSIFNLNTPADDAAAIKLKVPGRDFGLRKPTYPGAPLPDNPGTFPGAPYPENPGTFPGAPLPAKPAPELLQARPLTAGGAAPPEAPSAGQGRLSLTKQMEAQPGTPNPVNITGRMPYPAGRNIDLSPGMEIPGGAVVAPRVRGLLPSAPAEPPLTRLVDQMKTTAQPGAQTTLIEQMGGKPVETITQSTSPQLRPPITENPAVGNLSRALQKSGVPIADRPSLLLKGSGRVNRILRPNEDLTDAMAKSVRLAKRLRTAKASD
jgi:hypothetical protein